MIDEKDIIFGVVKAGQKKQTAIIVNMADERDSMAFMGALLTQCAMNPSFLKGLEEIVRSARRNGWRLREELLKMEAEGVMAVKKKDGNVS